VEIQRSGFGSGFGWGFASGHFVSDPRDQMKSLGLSSCYDYDYRRLSGSSTAFSFWQKSRSYCWRVSQTIIQAPT
jgi:hypothetical protein